jgi:hypothetical protein
MGSSLKLQNQVVGSSTVSTRLRLYEELLVFSARDVLATGAVSFFGQQVLFWKMQTERRRFLQTLCRTCTVDNLILFSSIFDRRDFSPTSL